MLDECRVAALERGGEGICDARDVLLLADVHICGFLLSSVLTECLILRFALEILK